MPGGDEMVQFGGEGFVKTVLDTVRPWGGVGHFGAKIHDLGHRKVTGTNRGGARDRAVLSGNLGEEGELGMGAFSSHGARGV